MTEADVESVSRVVSAGYAYLAEREGYSTDQVARLQAERASVAGVRSWPSQWRCFVAEWKGGVVGVLAVDRDDVAELWVHPAYHRRGVGTALFVKAQQSIAEQGYSALTVHCAGSSMQPFYAAMQCTAAGTRRCSSGPLAGWLLTQYHKQLKAQHPAAPSCGRCR